jgi:hypothetical protein
MNTKKTLIIGIAMYIVSAVGSFILFSNVISGPIIDAPVPDAQIGADGNVAFDDSLPKTEACPLNGAMYSKQQRQWWEKHRPLGIMVENSTDARPQSGLSTADVIYEVVAEGGITRFLAVFHCQNAEYVGPVRSARTYFLDFISEYGDYPLYVHVGGANCDPSSGSGCANGAKADALGQIRTYGWSRYNDLDQFGVPCPVLCRYEDRLPNRATEHTMYTGTSKLWEFAKTERELTNEDADGNDWTENFVAYEFKDDAAANSRPSAQTVSFYFWDGYDDFAVSYKYDRATNSYLRSNGGESHTDLNTKKQLAPKNLVVLFMTEGRANDGYPGNLHMLYGTKGTGNASVFMDGREIDAKWTKRDRESRLTLTDASGEEIKFNRGQIWFSVVSPDTDIEVN